ncbi:MAG TPA: bifunctional 4-hydroxy-2-oxoglutarate aldolase/2-dehydro-3-deoxy-phosphogluconate aldolase [Nevskiaceae bacterium]|nr:bifunctional 4-hydroxy-2-oxoglutarate aldolase/2-dehydro-3-deoxy-phosphogluconate aldolase [Nevskiaceae bacterium]
MSVVATQADKQARLAAILARAPVVPVVTIDDAQDALPMARVLAAGGIGAIEITLRTAAGMAAIRAIADGAPDVVVGAGTVLDAHQIDAATAAGAGFLVSPGAAPKLLDAAEHSTLPWLPGIATVGEALALVERGYRQFKFFPAVAAGGVNWLSAARAPLAQARFCPTGGVTQTNAAEFLVLPNVVCVGGSWVAPRALVAAHAWGDIERLARDAAALVYQMGRGTPSMQSV